MEPGATSSGQVHGCNAESAVSPWKETSGWCMRRRWHSKRPGLSAAIPHRLSVAMTCLGFQNPSWQEAAAITGPDQPQEWELGAEDLVQSAGGWGHVDRNIIDGARIHVRAYSFSQSQGSSGSMSG